MSEIFATPESIRLSTIEKERQYRNDRGADLYRDRLNGINAFYSTLNVLFPGERISLLDVGTGKGEGFNRLLTECPQEISGYGINLIPQLTHSRLTRVKVFVGMLEYQKFFVQSSLHGVISVCGFDYCNPQKTAEIMSQIIKPGGLIKAAFMSKGERERITECLNIEVTHPKKFKEELEREGFNVFYEHGRTSTILYAQKLGSREIRLDQLFWADWSIDLHKNSYAYDDYEHIIMG